MTPIPHLSLLCHPACNAAAVRTLTASARRTEDGGLWLAYRLRGDISRLRIAEPSLNPAQTDRLWEQTCFEAFIAGTGKAAYREYNFAPSGDWAVYEFSDYRLPTALDMPPPPRIEMCKTEGRLEVDAFLAPQCLPPSVGGYEIGLSAVVEATDICDGCHSYWALHHAGERPDFHQRASFILQLE